MMHDERAIETPYGSIRLELLAGATGGIALLHDELNPYAALYAAKELGVGRVIELVSVQPVDRLLEPGDVVVPHDLVDLTEGRRSTLFVNKGYGFLPQSPVFCPQLRAALLAAARASPVRSFARGVLATAQSWTQRQQARAWGAHMLGMTGAPATYLAKELELCYAPLAIVAAARAPETLETLLSLVAEQLPGERSCPCPTTMQATRQRGLVGDDWKTWL